jgi:hypothetical protein
VLNCTWDDQEAEIVLRRLQLHVEEEQKLGRFYLKLREEYRKSRQAQGSAGIEKRAD